MKRWRFVGTVAMAALLFAACQDGETVSFPAGGTTPAEGSTLIRVELDEWSVTPDRASAPAGSITFVARNYGSMRHDLVIIRTGLAPEDLPVSAATVDEAKAGQVVGVIKKFPPLRERSATFDLAPGKYALICNVAGHYRLGMFAAMEIQ